MQKTNEKKELARILGMWDAIGVMLGIVIGSGIFITPSIIAKNVPTMGGIIILWFVGGLLSWFGALSYAEHSASIPKTGGHYAFIREAYGPIAAFIFGWAYLLIAYPTGIAGLAHVFGKAAASFLPISELGVRLIAVGAIFLVAIPNYLGVRQGSTTQNIFAYGKIAAVIIVAVCGFVIGKGSTAHFQPFFSDSVTGLTTATIVAALVAVMWTYDGWCDVTPIVGEMKNPGKDMVRTLAIGMGSVIVLYIFMNFVYVYLVPLPEMAGLAGSEEMIATVASRNIFGAAGVSLIAALILVSTFGGLNGNMMAAPRVFFAMARDGYFFKKVGEIHPRFGTPYLAIVTTFVMASIYVLSGTFEQIINYRWIS